MAGKIPQTFIDDLLNRVDIVDVIDADVTLKKAGKDFQALCPFHGEKSPSFTVSQEKQFYHCFGCGAHGSAIGFVMNHRGLNFVEAVEELAHMVGLELPETDEPHTQAPDYGYLYDLLDKAQQFYSEQLREHSDKDRAIDYLKQRGLTGQIAKDFGVGFAPDSWDALLNHLGTDKKTKEDLVKAGLAVQKDTNRHYDRFRDRIMFPIHDRRGRVVAFGGRVIDKGEPKYLNSPETPIFHKRKELYGLYQVRKQSGTINKTLVVEGYMDAVALAQFGLKNVVATLGTAISKEQLEQLFRTSPEIVFCFDGDNAGHRAAWRALETCLTLIRDGRQAGFFFLPEGHDPDSYVRENGVEAFSNIANITPLSDFFFNELATRTNMETLDGRARLVELAKPLLAKIPAGSFQHLMQQRTSELAQIDQKAVDIPSPNQQRAAAQKRRPKRSTGGRQRPSVLRTALKRALLIPTVANRCEQLEALKRSDDPGIQLLCEILENARSNPEITTGGLLERYRDTKFETPLAELLETPLELDEDAESTNFLDAVNSLASKIDKPSEFERAKSELERRKQTPT